MPSDSQHRPQRLRAEAPQDEPAKQRHHGLRAAPRPSPGAIRTIRPSRMCTTRSAAAATSAACVASSTVTPARRFSSVSSASTRAPVLRIQVAGGLVGDEQRRLVDERAGDRRALHLAAGELRWSSAPADRTGRRDRRATARAAGPSPGGSPASSSGSAMFSCERQRRQQVEELEDEADAARRTRVSSSSLIPSSGTPSSVTRPEVGRSIAAAQVQQRGLAAARWADDGHELAARDLEADVADGVDPGRTREIGAVETVGDEQRRHDPDVTGALRELRGRATPGRWA